MRMTVWRGKFSETIDICPCLLSLSAGYTLNGSRLIDGLGGLHT